MTTGETRNSLLNLLPVQDQERILQDCITVLDQDGLERIACECAAAIRRRHESLFASLMG